MRSSQSLINDDGPVLESNSSQLMIHNKKSIQEQQCSGIGRVAEKAQMRPTCENQAEILLWFSVLIIIIIIEYNGIFD